MELETLTQRKAEIINQYGAWTAHNIDLGHGVYTLDKRPTGNPAARVVQIIADASSEPMQNLRVLDLACLEGLLRG